MSTGDLPPRRYLWSKYAWKTVREAMRSTPDTIRFLVIFLVMILLPASVALAWAVLIRAVWF